jgi:hypothetical protein
VPSVATAIACEAVGEHRLNVGFGAEMDGNINTLFNSLATTIRNVSLAIGVFAFMWGALQYATSGGSPHQLEMGKTAMKASLVGVGAIVLAATLVGIVFGALGGGAPGAA